MTIQPPHNFEDPATDLACEIEDAIIRVIHRRNIEGDEVIETIVRALAKVALASKRFLSDEFCWDLARATCVVKKPEKTRG